MADLTEILGDWSPSNQPQIDPPEIQLANAMRSAGLEPPTDIRLDGRLHRFASGTKGGSGHGDKSGWYVCFGDGIPAGRFGDWRSSVEMPFRADIGREISPWEEMSHTRRLSEARALRDAETEKQHEVAANVVETIWAGCTQATIDHPYLKRKGIVPHGARVTGDGRLVLPLYDEHSILCSLQYISADGEKKYHVGGPTSGKFWMVGSFDEPGTLYIAEGFATAATITEQTGRPCVAAYSASNLVKAAGIMRGRHGIGQDIVIVADNDESGVGQSHADQASALYKTRTVTPPERGDANDYVAAGRDLSILLMPPKLDWLVQADEFCSKPEPITWLVKKWIQAEALIMVHGPSAGGKTFVVLDWILRMAADIPHWCGEQHKIKPGAHVVYLAGEGHKGIKSRVAGWKHYHHVPRLRMHISRDGCDLNTREGLQRVVDNINSLKNKPAIIVVDTLHRFLLGDENSSVDTKGMLDACAILMRKYSCTVLLVHHTGVSEESQHRARGSSAWRGALDIEISIIPSKQRGGPIEIVQRKSKDSELTDSVWVELERFAVPGWDNEDHEPSMAAAVIHVEAPPEAKKDSKLDVFKKTITDAFWSSGAEVRDGKPYISRSGLVEKLTADGVSETLIARKLRPGSSDQLIGALRADGSIIDQENGWVVAEAGWCMQLILLKNSR